MYLNNSTKNAISTKYAKARIDNMLGNSKCMLCGNKYETVFPSNFVQFLVRYRQ